VIRELALYWLVIGIYSLGAFALGIYLDDWWVMGIAIAFVFIGLLGGRFFDEVDQA
jgi:hypothetical protein